MSKDYDESSEDDETMMNKNGPEKFLWACEKGRLDLVSQMLEEDPSSVHVEDSDKYFPLHRASYNNHPRIVEVLLRAGSPVDCRTADDWTPLHSACKWNHPACVALLAEAGAAPNARTASGQTPLHIAATNRDARETLQVLLLHPSVDTRLRNNTGETAKQIAIRSGPYGHMFEEVENVLNPFTV